MGNSSLANSWQQVNPADVTELAQSQGLQILASVQDNKVLGDLGIQPEVVTPNGDGINDVLTVDFTVRRLSGDRPVQSADLRPRWSAGAPPRYPEVASGGEIRARLGGR